MSAPAGAFSVFPHCRSSVCSRRSLFCISPLPQQCPLPQEPFLYFPTAAAVSAPTGALSVFPHCRSSVCSRRSAICFFPTAAAVSAPAGALSVFSHCRSSARSSRSAICISPLPQQCLLPQERYLFFPTAAAVLAPAGAFLLPAPPLPVTQIPSPFHHPIHPQRPIPFPNSPTPPRESPPAVFFTAAAVPAPAGTFSIFPHCRSSARSSRSLFYIFPNAAAVPAPTGALSVFPHCLSSICSRRSAICISPLPQQCLLPQERYLYFPTAAAVSAPAGALSVFPHCRSSACSSRSLFSSRPLPSPLPKSPPSPFHHPQRPIPSPFPNSPTPPQESPPAVFFTAAAVPAPAGTFSIFPHCRSSACSSRSLSPPGPSPPRYPNSLPLPSPNPPTTAHSLSQQPHATTGIPTSGFLHCRSSACSSRNLLYISPLPQQCPLQQEPFLYFPQCRSSACSHRSAICISPLPQ